jgi:hypothetical protein
MSYRLANIKIDIQLFLQSFCFPEDTIIRNIKMGDDMRHIVVTLENQELPEVSEGCVVPTICPQYTVEYGEAPIIKKTMDWNINK